MNTSILVETSARHVHLTPADMSVLFGEGSALTVKRMLSQPGQFLSNEKVTVVGPRSSMSMSVLGPERKATQVEISLTDARALGVTAPVRESGDLAGSGAIRIEGPKGAIEITEGVIAAKRHIHFTPADAADLGVTDKQIVSVKVGGERGAVLGEVVVRVSEKFARAMHVDVDEANAIAGATSGEIIK